VTDVVDLTVAFLIGALVGMGELVGRYRDEPGRAVRSLPAFVYMAINGAASAAALGLSHLFGWTFGAVAGSDQARATQIVVAGFGAMAIFRSSLFLYRVGNREIGIGPVAFLQVMLEATDRGVDRHRAQARSAGVRRIMSGLDFDTVAITLPAYAIGLMQNLSEQDQSVLSTRVDDVRKSPQDPRMKAMGLGLLVMDAVGEVVLEEAVLTVKKELGLESKPADGGQNPLSSILSRVRNMPGVSSLAPPKPPEGEAADTKVVPPPAESSVVPPPAESSVPSSPTASSVARPPTESRVVRPPAKSTVVPPPPSSSVVPPKAKSNVEPPKAKSKVEPPKAKSNVEPPPANPTVKGKPARS
jgi:hypothetical protein